MAGFFWVPLPIKGRLIQGPQQFEYGDARLDGVPWIGRCLRSGLSRA